MANHPSKSTADADDLRFVAELRASLASIAAADTIGVTVPPERLLELIVRTAARAIPCPEGALMLVDRARQRLTFDVVIGSTSTTIKDLTVPLGHGVAGLVAISGQALAIANAQEDPRHARDIAEKSGYLPTTILAVPVVGTDGSPVGVLELLDRQGQPAFSLADIELLGAFAEQIALVLDLRRSHDLLAARIGVAMGTIGGLRSETARNLAARVEALTSRIEADETSRRTNELAELVTSIAARGGAEHEACVAVLRAFSGYIDATPLLGVGMFQ